MPGDAARRLRRGGGWSSAFLWTSISQGLQGISRIALSILVARLAGREWLGITNSLLSVVTFLVLCWPQASGVAATRFVAAARGRSEDTSSAAWTAQVVGLVPCAPLAVIALLIGHGQVGAGWATAWTAAVLVPVLGAGAVTRGIRSGRQQFGANAGWDAVGAILAIALMLALLQGGRDDLALLAIGASSLPAVLTGLVWGRPALPSRVGREIARFTGWTSVHIIAAGGLLPALTLIVAASVSADDLGDFAAAASIATPIYLLSTAMRVSFEPFLARLHAAGQPEAVRRATDHLVRGMVGIFVPLTGLLALWAGKLLALVYPSEFSSARPTFLILLVGVGVTCVNGSQAWLSATRSWGPRFLAMANLAGLFMGLLTGAVGASLDGSAGAACGLLLGSTLSTALSTVAVWRAERMAWSPLLVRMGAGTLLYASAVSAHELRPGLASLLAATFGTLVVWFAVERSDLRVLLTARRQARDTTTAKRPAG